METLTQYNDRLPPSWSVHSSFALGTDEEQKHYKYEVQYTSKVVVK